MANKLSIKGTTWDTFEIGNSTFQIDKNGVSYKIVSQASHSFAKGDIVFYNGTSFEKSRAVYPKDRVDGIVYEVINANSFKLSMTQGQLIDLTGVLDDQSNTFAVNTDYYLSQLSYGKLSTKPSSGVALKVLKTFNSTLGMFLNEPDTGASNIDAITYALVLG